MRRRAAAPVLIGSLALAVATAGTAVAGHAAFTDTVGHTHEAGVHWLADSGITSGCGEGRFCPDGDVTRGQLATFLRRLAGDDPAVPPVVDAATVGGMSADQLRGQQGPAGPRGPAGPTFVAQQRSQGPVTLERYAPPGAKAVSVELKVTVPPGARRVVQVNGTYKLTEEFNRNHSPDCDSSTSSPQGFSFTETLLLVDGVAVFTGDGGRYPINRLRDDDTTFVSEGRHGLLFVTDLAEGTHTFALQLEGFCGVDGSPGGGSLTINEASLSLLNVGE